MSSEEISPAVRKLARILKEELDRTSWGSIEEVDLGEIVHAPKAGLPRESVAFSLSEILDQVIHRLLKSPLDIDEADYEETRFDGQN